eukprot:scaffold2101_cov79-Phaeocystis_antarctica.AAC.1
MQWVELVSSAASLSSPSESVPGASSVARDGISKHVRRSCASSAAPESAVASASAAALPAWTAARLAAASPPQFSVGSGARRSTAAMLPTQLEETLPG